VNEFNRYFFALAFGFSTISGFSTFADELLGLVLPYEPMNSLPRRVFLSPFPMTSYFYVVNLLIAFRIAKIEKMS